MKLITTLVGVLILLGFISSVLFVLLGQITVRKLRKAPETKHDLDIEFASGWDIINVAQALSIPQAIIRKLRNSPLSFLESNADLLYQHTTVFDRFLARMFYGLMMFTGLSFLLWAFLDVSGILS